MLGENRFQRRIAQILFGIVFFISHDLVIASDFRSDSLDLHHIGIHLDITDLNGKKINGYTDLTCIPKVGGLNKMRLDLLKLQVDSVRRGNLLLAYTYDDTVLSINLGAAFGPADTFVVRVYYQGSPVKDLSNWGGFYFQSGYAFNLGVGFDASPHSFGRAWFPCFDNFIERSKYGFEIITSGGRKAYCNGEFIGSTALSGDTAMYKWEMDEEIPSYLACVAVGPYSEVRWEHQGVQSLLPVVLAVHSADSNKLKASFIHLNDAIDAFEDSYGPYLFNKVGYSIVPFGSGAMEHASNIAYPSNMVNGNTSGEGLMSHELSHHWWGNLVTCKTQEDMWLNEGWASYSAFLFQEKVYGKANYLEQVRANHIDVIQYAHIIEEEFRAVSGVPHKYTYGKHVYDKGATVVHNLRTYLGDSLFFAGVKYFLDKNKFTDITSAELRDDLSFFTGKNLTSFFDDWVFGPGFPHLNADSFTVSGTTGNFQVNVFVKQKKRGNLHFFDQIPLTVTFYDASRNSTSKTAIISGEFSKLTFTVASRPEMVILNENDALMWATTADQRSVGSPSNFDFVNGKMKVNVKAVSDSILLRVEHHWCEPDALKNQNIPYKLSNYRYWKVDGIFPQGLRASAEINFDGRNIQSGGGGNLDNDLTINDGDSIVLLYRKNSSFDWWEYQHYSKVSFPGIPFGTIKIDSLIPGEYVLANGYSAIGQAKTRNTEGGFVLSPNPATSRLAITDTEGDTSEKELYIFSLEGKLKHSSKMRSESDVDVSNYKSSAYLVFIRRQDGSMFSGRFVVTD